MHIRPNYGKFINPLNIDTEYCRLTTRKETTQSNCLRSDARRTDFHFIENYKESLSGLAFGLDADSNNGSRFFKSLIE